jgi:hypothetical protein
MKFLSWWWSVVCAFAIGSVTAAEGERHVVLITIDGFPAAMLKDPKTPIPRIRELATEGTMADGMRVVVLRQAILRDGREARRWPGTIIAGRD